MVREIAEPSAWAPGQGLRKVAPADLLRQFRHEDMVGLGLRGLDISRKKRTVVRQSPSRATSRTAFVMGSAMKASRSALVGTTCGIVSTLGRGRPSRSSESWP
jgi:hypothetical protein